MLFSLALACTIAKKDQPLWESLLERIKHICITRDNATSREIAMHWKGMNNG